jgi:hypothetical protein
VTIQNIPSRTETRLNVDECRFPEVGPFPKTVIQTGGMSGRGGSACIIYLFPVSERKQKNAHMAKSWPPERREGAGELRCHDLPNMK